MAASALTLDAVRVIVARHKTTITEEDLKKVEEVILGYGKKLATEKDTSSLEELMIEARPLYELVGKAKAAKLIRELVELSLSIEQPPKEKISLVEKSIKWATDNNRVFLRRTLEARLIRLLNEQGKHRESMQIAGPLQAELKKLEDRELLMEVSLEESRSAFALKNFAKAKTALVLAKTSANGAYVSTSMQAAIDLQSGILYSADEQDFKTSYSYCYEALEGFQLAGDKANSIRALKYMILSKIMANEADHIPPLLASKVCSSVKGNDIEAVMEMAEAFRKRCLKSFQKCMDKYTKELVNDTVVSTHSIALQNNMLEKEISRVVEPYSELDLSYIVKKVEMPLQRVEKVISMMILDKKIYGCIDQHNGAVKIFTPPSVDKVYQKANELIKSLNRAVDATYTRATKIK